MPHPSMPTRISALRPELLKRARHLTGSRAGAQDLVQDVLIRLWLRLRAGDEIRDLRAYAMTALRNQFRQMMRDRRPKTDLMDDMLVVSPDAFAHLALGELDRAIARLPREQALLIRMVASGETSPTDLARRTGWPKGTVMSRLARARARLRQDMGMDPHAPISTLI